jgi:thiol-disulfide isomerase/thioredoxin
VTDPIRPHKGWRVLGLVAGVAALVTAIVVALNASNTASGAGGVSNPTAFDLPRLDGTGRVQLVAYRGRPVVVNLFASWCPSCQQEMPGFASVAKALSGRVAFIGVDSEDTGDGLGLARRFGYPTSGIVLAHDIGGPTGTGLHDALRAPGMPATAFYDANGHLVFKAIAAMPEATLRAELRRLYGVNV